MRIPGPWLLSVWITLLSLNAAIESSAIAQMNQMPDSAAGAEKKKQEAVARERPPKAAALKKANAAWDFVINNHCFEAATASCPLYFSAIRQVAGDYVEALQLGLDQGDTEIARSRLRKACRTLHVIEPNYYENGGMNATVKSFCDRASQ